MLKFGGFANTSSCGCYLPNNSYNSKPNAHTLQITCCQLYIYIHVSTRTLIFPNEELNFFQNTDCSSTTLHKCGQLLFSTGICTRLRHISEYDMTNTSCDYINVYWNPCRTIARYRHIVARAAESTGCTLHVHAPIDSLNNASHDAAPHLAAPFIADRTKASIAANI